MKDEEIFCNLCGLTCKLGNPECFEENGGLINETVTVSIEHEYSNELIFSITENGILKRSIILNKKQVTDLINCLTDCRKWMTSAGRGNKIPGPFIDWKK